MDKLPAEIFLHIAYYLDPSDIVALQSVNRTFLHRARDNNLWRNHCLIRSSFLASLSSYRADTAQLNPSTNSSWEQRHGHDIMAESHESKVKPREKIHQPASWDPINPREDVCWYDEYIARNGSISMSWLQQPRRSDKEYLEIRGMGLFKPEGEQEATLVISPLDNGTVCLWDIRRRDGRRRSIVARSKEGLLSVDPGSLVPRSKRSKMINTGVTECVSVDSARKKAYFAVQSSLIEVDLETLSQVSHERYPFSITALSEARYPVPLTVGTNLSLYLHDTRARVSIGHVDGDSDRLDHSETLSDARPPDFQSWMNLEPNPRYAHLHHPGPLSILHLPSAFTGMAWDGNGEIYVAGRFPSILAYERRCFPKLRGTIHSGARLCSLAWLPDSLTRITRRTLLACGEYNSKGSLEMYSHSLSSTPLGSGVLSASTPQLRSILKNRQTSASSKIFSVCAHGTRIVVSDGNGNLKWLERDGFTEVRSWNLAQNTSHAPPTRSIFDHTHGDFSFDSGAGDIVLKLANTTSTDGQQGASSDLALWTGEKIGLLNFSHWKRFPADRFEDQLEVSAEEQRREEQERRYAEMMGRVLLANADEVRWMRGLGMGMGMVDGP